MVYWFAVIACIYPSYLVRHLLGQINAPWVFKPNYLVYYVLSFALPLLAGFRAFGLHRRKPWALRVSSPCLSLIY